MLREAIDATRYISGRARLQSAAVARAAARHFDDDGLSSRAASFRRCHFYAGMIDWRTAPRVYDCTQFSRQRHGHAYFKYHSGRADADKDALIAFLS